MSRQEIYQSKAWKRIRVGYAISKQCMCERCHRAVYVSGVNDYLPKKKRLRYIVHHKEYIKEENKYNEDIVYNFDNLELLCIDCHNDEHFGVKATKKEYKFDDMGNFIQKANHKNLFINNTLATKK